MTHFHHSIRNNHTRQGADTRRLVLGLSLLLLVLLAEAASACPRCYIPPPYTRWSCGQAICGWQGCSASGPGTDCVHVGERCSENDEYCGNSDTDPYNQDWVRCGPAEPLAKRWTLVAVQVRHEKVRARG